MSDVARPDVSEPDLLAAIILTAGRRRSVDAARRILAGEVVERSPVVVIPPRDAFVLAETDLGPYLEPWPSEEGAAALPLGFAAMYHDSAQPNLSVVRRPGDHVLEIVAAADIEQGEEMTVPRRWRINGWTADQAQETDGPAPNAKGGDDG